MLMIACDIKAVTTHTYSEWLAGQTVPLRIFFKPIFKMRRKFWPRTMTTHLNMLKHLNKEIRRGKETCKQAGKETSKNASVTKQT